MAETAVIYETAETFETAKTSETAETTKLLDLYPNVLIWTS